MERVVHFPKEKEKEVWMLQRSERILVGGVPQICRRRPSRGLAACNPSHGQKLKEEVGVGGGRGRGRASLLQVCQLILRCAGIMEGKKKSKERKEMVEKRRATRITVYRWSRVGFRVGGADWCLATIGRAQRLVGRRASFDHASLYLGCSPEVKVL